MTAIVQRLLVLSLVLPTYTCPQAAARTRANAELPALISFSDGTLLAGKLRIIGSRPLIVTPTGGSQRRFDAGDILSIEQVVEKAIIERPWTFKEAGKPEKIYFEGHYPLLNFLTRVTLTNGKVVEGHAISAVYALSGEAGKQKVFLKRQIKGRLGQTVDDVVYVTNIRYTENAPVAGKQLSGTVKGCGRLQDARAIDLEREQVLHGKVGGDSFDFGLVLPGRYDLCLTTDRMVLVGLADETPAAYADGEPLGDRDCDAIGEVFPLADDFFNDRCILLCRGNRGYARTLVYKRRAKYHASDSITPGGWVWHIDVWNWHNPGTEWKLDSRHIVARHKQQVDESIRALKLVDELAAVRPGSKAIELDYERDNTQWTTLRTLD